MDLFIIGNGFDLEHGLPTEYWRFREYLSRRYNVSDEYLMLVPELMMVDKHGDFDYDMQEVSSYISRIIDKCTGENWGDLEALLGDTIIDALKYDLEDVDISASDRAIKHAIYANEELTENMAGTFYKLKSLFYDWVREELGSLEYEGLGKHYIASVLAEGDVFLSFNYTRTLEEVYRIYNVCHIHGDVNCTEEDIYFGHGEDEDVLEPVENLGAYENLNKLKRLLKKDTGEALRKRAAFFDGLKDVKSIHSFGFSFSDVDMVYVDEIAHRAPEATWYLNTFDAKNKEKRRKLEAKGFHIEVDDRW